MSSLEPHAKKINGHGVFSAEGEDWKRQRKLTAPAFTPVQVRNHYETITLVCSRLRRKWMKMITDLDNVEQGVVIDVLPDLMNLTLDIVSLIAFGYDLNSLEKESDITECLLQYLPFAYFRIGCPIPYWKLFYLPIDRRFYKGHAKVQDLIGNIISEFYSQSSNNDSTRSFIHTILQAREADKNQLTDEEIFGNVITILLAGQDTTANTLAWSLYYLSRNHTIQEDLYNEITNYLPDGNEYIDKSDIDKLSLCSDIIQETLRIRGPSPVIYLEANDNIIVEGNDSKITLSKGDVTILLIRSMTKDEESTPNPKIFNPYRWKENNVEIDPFLKTLPFGGGPRVCPGKTLSLFESKMFLSSICSDFIIRPENTISDSINNNLQGTEDPSVSETLAFTMSPTNLKLRFFLRNK